MGYNLVSILIPVYKVEKYIAKCARSLFEQTYENIEYIFVDDCSPDNSMKVLADVLMEYPNRKNDVRIIKHNENRGLAAARNTAVDYSHGEYLMHVDSDDYIERDTISNMLEEAVNKKLDIVICDTIIESESTSTISRHADVVDKMLYLKDLLIKKVAPSIWGKLISKNLYKNVRAIDHIDHGEDYVTTPRLVYYAKTIGNLHKPLYHYTLLNNNAYTRNLSLNSIDQMVKADKILDDFFSAIPEKNEFSDTLIMSKLRTKVNLLKRGKIELFEVIASLYPELTYTHKQLLSLKDRVLLNLVMRGYYKLAVNYIHIGFKISHVFKYGATHS